MGCGKHREANPLEVALTSAQKRLGFHKCRVASVLSAFQSWSLGDFVLHKHFIALAQKLKLAPVAKQRCYARLHVKKPAELSELVAKLNPELGTGFVDEDDPVYDKKGLVIIGVLLAKGENYDKGAAIFRVFDQKCDGEFRDAHLRMMLRELFRIAIEVLPSCLEQEEESIEMKNYLNQCKTNVEAAVQEAVSVVLDRRRYVSEEQFADKLEEFEAASLCSPSGLRKRAFAAQVATGSERSFGTV